LRGAAASESGNDARNREPWSAEFIHCVCPQKRAPKRSRAIEIEVMVAAATPPQQASIRSASRCENGVFFRFFRERERVEAAAKPLGRAAAETCPLFRRARISLATVMRKSQRARSFACRGRPDVTRVLPGQRRSWDSAHHDEA
jgi:hypothetical protein